MLCVIESFLSGPARDLPLVRGRKHGFRRESRCPQKSTPDIPTAPCAGRTAHGSERWGASAEYVTEGSARFTTMNLQTASIRFPSWSMRSFLFLVGANLDINQPVLQRKISAIFKLLITFAISERATIYQTSDRFFPSKSRIGSMANGDAI